MEEANKRFAKLGVPWGKRGFVKAAPEANHPLYMDLAQVAGDDQAKLLIFWATEGPDAAAQRRQEA
eukprot:12732188-Alexandrium_andersonii.AAC.1